MHTLRLREEHGDFGAAHNCCRCCCPALCWVSAALLSEQCSQPGSWCKLLCKSFVSSYEELICIKPVVPDQQRFCSKCGFSSGLTLWNRWCSVRSHLKAEGICVEYAWTGLYIIAQSRSRRAWIACVPDLLMLQSSSSKQDNNAIKNMYFL